MVIVGIVVEFKRNCLSAGVEDGLSCIEFVITIPVFKSKDKDLDICSGGIFSNFNCLVRCFLNCLVRV
jgi:hypothetical protein